jgi:acyl-CoA synthetase (NDP forming)
MNEKRLHNLRRLLNPKSVALVGGAALAASLEILKSSGYRGEVYVVNPKYAEIGGVRCVPSIADLPQAPDASFLAVNRHLTVTAVSALAAMGAGGAVCFAAGFRELSVEGGDLERRLIEGAGDLAVLGPNSNGLLNRLDGLALWPMNDHHPVRQSSGVALVSQSGGVGSLLVRDRRGIAPAIIASTGNQTLLGPAEWLTVLAPDPRIRAIGLFIEEPGDIANLSVAAAAARFHDIPVVALKSGRTELGMQLAATHTGSMAGDDELFDAFCDRVGFVRVRSLPQMTETLKALGAWRSLPGARVVVATSSGAACALYADAAADVGLALPTPSAEMARRLRPQLPEFAHVSNPLDHNAAYTGQVGLTLENEPALTECFRTLLSDEFDVALMHSDWTEFGAQGSPVMRAWITAAREAGIPAALVSLMPENMSRDAQELCRVNGLAALQGLDEALFAVAAAVRRGERVRDAADERAELPVPLPEPVKFQTRRRVWNEWDSMQWLASVDVPFPRRERCGVEDAAGAAQSVGAAAERVVAAAKGVGFPVVLKAVSAALPHKHQVGAVAVGLADGAEVQTALERISGALETAGIEPEAFLVAEMVDDSVAELIVGVKSSAVYGHALIIGAGGIGAEHLNDSAALLLPTSGASIRRALDGLRVAKALTDDMRATVCRIAVAVAEFTMVHRDRVVALDLNPLIVTRAGRVVAVDALIETHE